MIEVGDSVRTPDGSVFIVSMITRRGGSEIATMGEQIEINISEITLVDKNIHQDIKYQRHYDGGTIIEMIDESDGSYYDNFSSERVGYYDNDLGRISWCDVEMTAHYFDQIWPFCAVNYECTVLRFIDKNSNPSLRACYVGDQSTDSLSGFLGENDHILRMYDEEGLSGVFCLVTKDTHSVLVVAGYDLPPW